MRPVTRRALVLGVAAILAGCGSTPTPAPSASSAVAPPSVVASPTLPSVAPTHPADPVPSASPAATPSSTPEPSKTIADLIADPLPPVSLGELGAMDPSNWATLQAIPEFVWSYENQNAPFPSMGIALRATLCAGALPMVPAAERLTIRETHCLLLVAAGWLRYASNETAGDYDRARAAYAFAAATIGPKGRAFLDQTLEARMPQAGSRKTPTPSPSGLRTAAAFLAERVEAVDVHDFARIVRDAIAAAPASYAETYLVSGIQTGHQLVKGAPGGPYPKGEAIDSALEVCAYGFRDAFNARDYGAQTYDLDMQDACETVLTRLWNGYRATGATIAYQAALFSYRLGIQGAPPCAKVGVLGVGCPAEWIDGLRLSLR